MKIAWKPQPKQATALKIVADELLFGGARGGGKTDTGMVRFLYETHHPKFRGLVLRKNSVDLTDWIDRARIMYGLVGATLVNKEFRFPSGAVIRTGHLDSADAYQKYQGHEYHLILIEELTQIPRESDYEKVRASNRSTVPDIKPALFATTNPDGPGHGWVKERWNIPDKPGDEPIVTKTRTGEIRVFVPSRVYDNEVLLKQDPGYVKKLEELGDEDLRRAWLDGSWEGFKIEGAYYHKQMQAVLDEKRVIPNLYDPALPVYTWCDLGISDHFTIGYFQFVGNDIRVIDYEEFNGEGLLSAIKRMKDKNYIYQEHYAPHDIRVRELGTGESRYETAQKMGVNYGIVPNIPRQDGIEMTRIKLARCYFDLENTKLLRDRLRNYRKKEDTIHGGFKNDPVHDENSHGADMMRYMSVTKIAGERADEATPFNLYGGNYR